MTDFLDGVTWFRHSSLRIRRAGLEIHVDPWGVTEESEADYVLLTHPHYDNFSEEDLDRVRGQDTVVVAPSTMKKQVGEVDHFVRPGDLIQLDRIDILAVPAHNQDRRFHPPDAGWVGYVFSLGGVTFYHSGHTDFLNSMEAIRCDVAFLPCCSDYTLSPREAALAGEACGASVLVPLHWSDHGGGPQAALSIAGLFPGKVRFLERKG